jgi:O-methyltransferase
MCSTARLRGLYQAVQYVVSRNIEGDVVECGTARGGSAALMGLTLNQLHSDRMLWVFDSFEGLPPPSKANQTTRVLNTGLASVEENCQKSRTFLGDAVS